MDRRIERGQSTRHAILLAAVDLFTEHGYEATSIELVLDASAVSRGALYHHFTNKEALFVAVLESVEERIAQTVREAADGATNPLDALRLGCAAWLDLASDPVVRRIVLIDAPSAVGWQAWRAIDDRYALGLLKAVLGAAAAAGRLRLDVVDTYAHVLLAALIELSLLIARNPTDPNVAGAARSTVETIVSRLLGFDPDAVWRI